MLPEVDTRPVLDAWARGRIDAVTVASRESLENLHRLLGASGRQFLVNTQLIVGDPRCAGRAEELGHISIMVAGDASDEAMVEALEQWALSR